MNPELVKQVADRLREVDFPSLLNQPHHMKPYFRGLLTGLWKGQLLIVRPAQNADGTTSKVFEIR